MSKKKQETPDIDNEYQNEKIARQAFYLRTHIQVLNDEVTKFKNMVRESDAPQDTKDWLIRVHNNVLRNFGPSINNLDQVRFVLDKKRQGLTE